MSGSMGLVMMNWAAELIRHKKRRKRRNDPASCASCPTERSRAEALSEEVARLRTEAAQAAQAALDKEAELRCEAERLRTAEADLRLELEEVRKTTVKIQKDKDMVEEFLSQKEIEWAQKVESLERNLHNAIQNNYEANSVAEMSRTQLEQELCSLSAVLDMRSSEISELRNANHELHMRLEKQFWTENELGKARQRLEEMNLVLQNKMVAEKELIDMTEGLTNDLANARNEIIALRRDLENRQYLRRANQSQINSLSETENSSSDSPSLDLKHRNHHQKASSGGSNLDPSLVLDVVERPESVAWILHIPDSPKLQAAK